MVMSPIEIDQEDDQIVTMEFFTAWGPPEPILKKDQ